MFFKRNPNQAFLEALCADYYPKVLRYLSHLLGEETAARDVTQETFLVAWQKIELLKTHPNPGGFLFQTAKNLGHKARREAFTKFLTQPFPEGEGEPADPVGGVEIALDRCIPEEDYIEDILSRLTPEKRLLYQRYYLAGESMGQIAGDLGLEEPALRMRFVRLRREIRTLVAELSEKEFAL